MPDLTGKPFRILIIDDEPIWHTLIGDIVENLGGTWQPASSFEEAKVAIKRAEEGGTRFSVATIDMGFEVGKRSTEILLGKRILRHIKSNHPYIACIMVSGSPETVHQVLKLRDDYELDDYISKDRLDLQTFSAAIANAMKRVMPLVDKGDKMVDPAMWMNILAGAATVLYTEVGALLKERREARQAKHEAQPATAKEGTQEAAVAPSAQPPLRDEAELVAVLKEINLQQYVGEIDRVKSLQEIIGDLRRTFNDYEAEANKPGLSMDERVGARQQMENIESKITKYGLELQRLMENISGRKIEA